MLYKYLCIFYFRKLNLNRIVSSLYKYKNNYSFNKHLANRIHFLSFLDFLEPRLLATTNRILSKQINIIKKKKKQNKTKTHLPLIIKTYGFYFFVTRMKTLLTTQNLYDFYFEYLKASGRLLSLLNIY
jgi:hypothetical protein